MDLKEIAKATAGASGAELANIINEAALRAVRMGRDVVIQADLEESVEVILAGQQRKSMVISPKEKEIVAYHEVGHALVAALQTDSAPVHKITIIPRTSGALGYTMQVDEQEKYLMTRDEAFNKIVTLTAGRVSEELMFHTITTGASNDIEQATRMALCDDQPLWDERYLWHGGPGKCHQPIPGRRYIAHLFHGHRHTDRPRGYQPGEAGLR